MLVQHTLADVVIVRARVQGNVRLDRDGFSESSIGCFHRMVVAFPSPRIQLHAALLPCSEGTLERGVESVRKLRSVGSLHLAFWNFRVPNVMEIRSIGIVVG